MLWKVYIHQKYPLDCFKGNTCRFTLQISSFFNCKVWVWFLLQRMVLIARLLAVQIWFRMSRFPRGNTYEWNTATKTCISHFGQKLNCSKLLWAPSQYSVLRKCILCITLYLLSYTFLITAWCASSLIKLISSLAHQQSCLQNNARQLSRTSGHAQTEYTI